MGPFILGSFLKMRLCTSKNQIPVAPATDEELYSRPSKRQDCLLRMEYPGAIYHVMNPRDGREDIFIEFRINNGYVF